MNTLPSWSHSKTSQGAAADAAPRAKSQKQRIWEYLRDYPSGLIYERIAHDLGLPIQSMSTRMTQMRDDGMIAYRLDGEGNPMTDTTSEGSEANVYIACPEPWTPVPRRPRGKKFDALYTAASEVIRTLDEKDTAAMRQALSDLRRAVTFAGG